MHMLSGVAFVCKAAYLTTRNFHQHQCAYRRAGFVVGGEQKKKHGGEKEIM